MAAFSAEVDGDGWGSGTTLLASMESAVATLRIVARAMKYTPKFMELLRVLCVW